MSTDERINSVLRRAASGDEQAWRRILEVYSRRVFGLIRAKCGDADLAEEITQSCFCTVADKLCDGSYLEQGKFEAWLFRIAMNRFRDEMRRRARQAVPTDTQTLVALADRRAVSRHRGAASSDRPSSPDADSQREDLDALSKAMAALPEADIEVLHLRHQGGLAFREIAAALGQPLGTVLARHHRALTKIRDAMSQAIER